MYRIDPKFEPQLIAYNGVSQNASIVSIARDYELPFFGLPTRHQQLLPPQLHFSYASGSSEPKDITSSPSLLRSEQLPFGSDYTLDESHEYALGDINSNTYERTLLGTSDPNNVATPQIAFGQSELNDISDKIYRSHPTYADVFNGTTSSPQLFPGPQFDAITRAESFYDGTLDGIASFSSLEPQLGGIENSIYGNENPYATFANAIASPQLFAPNHGVESNVFNGAIYDDEQNRELAQPVLGPRHADTPTPPDNEVNASEGAPSSQGAQCGDNCRGDIM